MPDDSETPRHTSPGHPAFHAVPGEVAAEYWEASIDEGLTRAEVLARRARLGENVLPEAPQKSALRQLVDQVADPLVGALLVAALVSMGVAISEGGHESWLLRFSDTIAILLIVVVNALLGFFQERRAEAALDALAKMAAPLATVLREGGLEVLPARALVPGDVVELEAGDAVPADVRLVQTEELATEEAALTGESTPVSKDAEARVPQDAPLGDRETMVYLGTTVVRGRARGVVVQTGAHTQLGRIGTLIRGVEQEDTPLERRLSQLGRIILLVCLALSAALFLLGLAQGTRSWTVLLLTAVSLAVAAIPEGLPAITTITLALGMQRMARRGAIIRKLPAVETLGSATIICSDKTGTLTQNAMTVRALSTADADYEVTGGGSRMEGALVDGDGAPVEPTLAVRRLVEIGALCNTARVDEVEGETRIVGDPTEAALLALAAKLGVDRDALRASVTIERTLPFDSDRKRMSVVGADADGTPTAWVKGSADVLLPLCDRVLGPDGPRPLDDAERARLDARNEEYARRALRVLALCLRRDPDDEDPERGLTFVGLAAMIDPPRPEVKDAIAECHRAGIRVVMITGDHPLTAEAIGRELGLYRDGDRSMTGAELAALGDQKLQDQLDDVTVYARTTAEQKLRLVRALRRRGHVAAMTGDGVNDAPALREADIGVAMGKQGTDVAREAAEMVLSDDNFASIVEAVREGRAIFRNIQKFIFFLNSSNAGLVVAVIVGSFFDWMPQLTPLQLLWVNLVTNGLPALALGVDPPEPGQMDERPRPPSEPMIGWTDLGGMLLVGAVMGGAALSLYFLPSWAPGLVEGEGQAALQRSRTLAFTLLAVSPMFHAFNCRSRTTSAFRRPFSNRFLWGAIGVSVGLHAVALLVPFLHPIFRTHAPTLTEWAVVLVLAALPIPVFEAIKLVRGWLGHGRAGRAR